MLNKIETAACLVFAAYIAVCVVILAIGSAASVAYLAGHYLFGAF